MDPYQSNDELCNALLNRSSNQLGNRFWRDKKVSPQKKILFSIFLVVVSIPFLFVTINHYHETKERLFAKNGIHKTNDLQLQKTSSGTVRFGGDNDHSGPTVLSVIDESTNQFISVTNNPIYKLLQSSRFIGSGTSNSQSSIHVSDVYGVFQLFLDKEEMYSFHEPLEVTWSWSPEADNNSLTEGSKINGGVYEDDVLALYCQPLSLKNLSEEVNFFDFSKPRDAASIAQTRSSSRFHYPNQMLNNNTWYIPSFPTIREETCHFRLLRRMGTFRSNPGLLLLAVSNNLHLPSKNTATGVHLSLTNNPEEMVVQFTTGANGIPLVEVTHHDGTIFVYQGNSTTYTNKDMCQAPANSTEIGCFIPPGNLHTVLIENLVPSTKYLYRVGLKSETDQEGEYNEDYYSFITIPTIGSNDPFAFIAYGDQGCPVDGWALGGNMSAIMVERELDNAIIPIRAVHHFGDLSYARGHAHLWDDWLDMISIFSSRVPLLVGVGNHEYDHTAGGTGKDPSGETTDGFRPIWGNFGNDSGGECGIPTSKRFFVPPNGNGVFWYSHDMGLVHTVMISSEHSLHKTSRQYKWLENDLKSVDRSVTPWVIIESHRPMYMNENEPDEILVEIAMRHEFEKLLIKYDIDLFLAGHFHAYHRTCNGLYNSTCNNGGLTHITVGTAGAKLDTGTLIPSYSKWTEAFLKDWGYGKVTIYNSSSLHWSFVSSYGENQGQTLDDFWITKER